MKLINPSFEILEQGPGLDGIYEAIERAGRTCYKSKRPEGQTAKDFVDRMIASQHYAMLEHGTVYLSIPEASFTYTEEVKRRHKVISKYKSNSYSKVTSDGVYSNITTNLRVLVENGWLDDLKYLCEPTEYHEKRVTVRFITGVDISREFNRHRVNSMAEQSTRYCNFSKDKFGNEITCIIPHVYLESLSTKGMNTDDIDVFYESLKQSEEAYFKLLELGWKPENARKVLPLDLATELVHTAFVSDWRHFFSLRAEDSAGKAHPDAKSLAKSLMDEFYKRNLLNKNNYVRK